MRPQGSGGVTSWLLGEQSLRIPGDSAVSTVAVFALKQMAIAVKVKR